MEIEDQVVRAWKTAREMLADRGYAVTDSVGDVEVAEMAREKQTFGVDAADRVSVVFHTPVQSVKKQDVFSSAGDVGHIVLVVNTKTSAKPNNSTAKSLESEASSRNITLDIFTLKEMQYNVSKHILVPEHRLLTKEATEDVFKNMCIKNRFQLPAIASTDPMARYLGLKHGDVIRIKRPSPTAGVSIAYRCCRRA
nr:DNA-directed RNA polymerase subunit Rpb5 [Oceanusvirus sp.]